MGPAYKVFFKPTSDLYKQKAMFAEVCLVGRAYCGLASSGPAGRWSCHAADLRKRRCSERHERLSGEQRARV